MRQQTGQKNIPVSLGWYSLFNVNATKDPTLTTSWNKFSFMHQLLIARKFSDKLSLQLMPTLIHFNIVPYGINNSNLVGSIGLGGKYKLTANKNITFEYARQLNMYENLNPFGEVQFIDVQRDMIDWIQGLKIQFTYGHTDAMMLLHIDAPQGYFVYCADSTVLPTT